MQRYSRKKERIIEKAQKRYEKNFPNSNIEATFTFVPSLADTKIIPLAKKIAEKIEVFKDIEKPKALSPKDFQDIPELKFVYINFPYENPKWRYLPTGNIELADKERLKQVIKNKEAKLCGYKNCDKYWLLLIIDFIDISQDQEIGNILPLDLKSEKFEKVILYKTHYEKLVEYSKSTTP